ncbi:MAG: hypothetical protein J2P21_04405 [Chloracidobacterium sp.]|nr:hypothetical protein [Chloracidobacterium sp.]
MWETLANGGPNGQAPGAEPLRRSVARKWVEDAEAYYDLIVSRTRGLDTEYLQLLEGDDPVLEWMKGTGLRPILNGLNGEEREIFLLAPPTDKERSIFD